MVTTCLLVPLEPTTGKVGGGGVGGVGGGGGVQPQLDNVLSYS